jgi:hypothetical protein
VPVEQTGPVARLVGMIVALAAVALAAAAAGAVWGALLASWTPEVELVRVSPRRRSY